MKTKTIIPLTIIAALPFAANAANIQGDMYVAPTYSDANHPAPTASVPGPYGRVNIDTDDQGHIATTAYVKGAYNSAIAAVNGLGAGKQNRLLNMETDVSIESEVMSASNFVSDIMENDLAEEYLVSEAAVAAGIDYKLDSKRVDIYTTWDTNNTTQVQLSNVRVQSND